MRFFDVTLSIIGLIIFTPFLLFICILVATTSKGSAIFVHQRVGKGCQKFNCYKLRTMYVGSDKNGNYMTKKNDKRITPLGHFLRKYSIDELPQLYNVIKGDMSLVGPRPDTPFQKSLVAPEEWEKRHTILPGITGLAQIKARHIASPQERLSYDLFYVDNISYYLYFKIIMITIVQLFTSPSY
tara:strand:- start:42 stop:593 length:552 start_codon:yes stop_codon:yes gene_type:complete